MKRPRGQLKNGIPQGVLVQFRLGAPSQTILCRSLKCLRICPLAGPPFGPPLCSTGCAGNWEETSRRRGRGPRPQSLSASTAQLTPTVRALRPKRALIERAGAGSRTARGRRASDRGLEEALEGAGQLGRNLVARHRPGACDNFRPGRLISRTQSNAASDRLWDLVRVAAGTPARTPAVWPRSRRRRLCTAKASCASRPKPSPTKRR